MPTPDGKLEMSPLGGAVSRNGLTVKVHIYRFAGTTDNWTLELVDCEGCSTVWELRFSDDLEAYKASSEPWQRTASGLSPTTNP